LGGIVCTTATPAQAQESSLADAKERVKQAPTSPEAALAYGRALRRAGHENEAMTELQRARAFARDATAVTVVWEIARTQIAKRDFFAARNTCGELKKLPNGVAASHVCTAEAHLLWRRGTEAMGELAEYAKVKGSAGADVDYFARLAEGRCRELDSKEADAEASYREALRLSANRPEGHMLLGAMLYRIGKDGIPELRRAVELDVHDPVAQFELGSALKDDASKRGDAIAAFERATAERPTYLEAYRSLAEVYVVSNRLADAKRVAASVLKMAPSDVLSHIINGRVALADNKPDDALKEGQLALKLMPNAGQAQLLIADVYAKQGERSIDLAVEAYQKASGLDPLDPTALINAAYACIAANRLTTAKAFGQRAVLDFPDFSPAWVAQGDALAADGNPRAARTSYETAKKKIKGADVAAIDGKLARLK
jgi:tetratricopeptide (TPR) repeat protein